MKKEIKVIRAEYDQSIMGTSGALFGILLGIYIPFNIWFTIIAPFSVIVAFVLWVITIIIMANYVVPKIIQSSKPSLFYNEETQKLEYARSIFQKENISKSDNVTIQVEPSKKEIHLHYDVIGRYGHKKADFNLYVDMESFDVLQQMAIDWYGDENA